MRQQAITWANLDTRFMSSYGNIRPQLVNPLSATRLDEILFIILNDVNWSAESYLKFLTHLS